MKEDPARRRKDLAVIHTGKKRLELDDENYRVLLDGLTGKRSAAELTPQERAKVITKMDELGAETAPRSTSKPGGQKWVSKARVKPSQDKARLIWKIEQLLNELGEKLSYAESILKQMFGDQAPAALEWATPEQLRKLVASLTYHKKRKARRES
jgi:phage gp16-like protein